eukprot:scaffold230204_cov16-Tisochrysis_lutea.AAC.1
MAEGDVLTTLGRELACLAAELDEAPREHQAVILLGEMAAYLADWDPTCRQAALKFASMTSRAADSMVGVLQLRSSGRMLLA